MVTKHTRQQWPYEPQRTQAVDAWLDKNITPSFHAEARQMLIEPQVMTDDEAENAYFRLLEQEDEPPTNGILRWILYGVFALLALAAGVHFVAEWAQGAPL